MWGRQARDKGKEPQVEELVQNRKLRDCVKSQESNDKNTKAVQHPNHQTPGETQDLDDEEPINFIDTVPAMRDLGSTSSGKASASICLITPKDAPRSWDPISFSTEDS
ncbi:hypothetical protein LWI29_005391 [Acer saccharum]|uniref:Uncharacterized protein n=1 Tax=Acer saccharum TaxID=4024 RepID=A0AA39SWI6_ACESA|nr:hypothetical protein LWI29_005391 [Acer saccharum]